MTMKELFDILASEKITKFGGSITITAINGDYVVELTIPELSVDDDQPQWTQTRAEAKYNL